MATFNEDGLGGIVAGGTTSINALFNLVTSGGIVSAGLASNDVFTGILASGGVVCAGQSNVAKYLTERGSQGLVAAAVANVQANYNMESINGLLLAGLSPFWKTYTNVGDGGSLANGSYERVVIFRPASSGGMLAADGNRPVGFPMNWMPRMHNPSTGGMETGTAGRYFVIFFPIKCIGGIAVAHAKAANYMGRTFCKKEEFRCNREKTKFCIDFKPVVSQGSRVLRKRTSAYLPPITSCRQQVKPPA